MKIGTSSLRGNNCEGIVRGHLAITAAGILLPLHTERMKYKRVSYGYLARLGHDLIGVVNNPVNSDTPWLVSHDALAMFAGCLGMVSITVIESRCAVVRHAILPVLQN
jgi:hypothetical protein